MIDFCDQPHQFVSGLPGGVLDPLLGMAELKDGTLYLNGAPVGKVKGGVLMAEGFVADQTVHLSFQEWSESVAGTFNKIQKLIDKFAESGDDTEARDQ